MTSLPTLLISFAVVGAIFTVWTVRTKQTKSTLLTFFQHFCGVWFIFSGLVKAVDPIGTAYKMEDYFAAFEPTFAGLNNVFAGIAPLFPWLAKYAEGFSIFMIVLEIVLGVMLIIGYTRKWTAWLFFLVVFFFTILTGFTYLTGFVPTEANFFDFAQWGPYVKTQMRVTDCGCFGDFIKLDPKISFFKDLGLMAPALFFLLRSRNMHQLWTARTRNIIVGISTVASLLFCLQNTYWDLPAVDFRPFKVGSNVRERKELETNAKVDILGWVLRNDSLDKTITYMEPEPGKITYYKEYPKNQGWKVKDQIQTDWYVEKDGQKIPITKTKVSDFAVESSEGEVTDDILNEKGYSLMIIAYKLKGQKQIETVAVPDTTWASDTIRVTKDSFYLQPRIVAVGQKTVQKEVFIPAADYAERFQKEVNPLAEAASKAGWKVYAITTYGDSESAADFAERVQAKYPFYKADDKLLKTIIRANPGVVVWKDGQVLDMYHHRHLPTFEELSRKWK
ncbi:MAG: DoxX family protein [Saprospiraceae bacterium]